MRVDNPKDGIIATAYAKMDEDPPPVQEFDMKVVADALVASSEALGMSARASQSFLPGGEGTWIVRCDGKRKAPTGPDVSIRFTVPRYGSMSGDILRGMETHGEAVRQLMHRIVADAYGKSGVLMIQTASPRVDTLAMSNPDWYSNSAQESGLSPEEALSRKGVTNGPIR